MVVALGGLGGIFYWMTIFPVDAVKSAMQTDDLRKPQRKFPTMASAVKVIPPKSVRLQLNLLKGILLALVLCSRP
jgi:Mitochondrial carrier protein